MNELVSAPLLLPESGYLPSPVATSSDTPKPAERRYREHITFHLPLARLYRHTA